MRDTVFCTPRFLLWGSAIDNLEEFEGCIPDRRKFKVNALACIVLEIVPDPLWCVSFRLHRPGQGSMQGARKKVLTDRGIHYVAFPLDQVVNLARG